MLFTAAAAENTGIEETNIDRPEPSSPGLYMVVDPNNRTPEPVYKQLNVKKLNQTADYVNLPRRKTRKHNQRSPVYENVKK